MKLDNTIDAKHSRYYDIDLLRFLAAVSVVLFHYTFRGYSADNLSNVTFYELSVFSKYGYLGVELFFMISGFVILMTAESGNVKKFMISRFIRLYPTFWIAVCFTSIIIILFDSQIFKVNLYQILINLTMIPSLFHIQSVDGVYWSLLVELKFYFLIVLLLAIKHIKHIKIYMFLWISWSIFFYFTHFPYKLNFILFPSFSSYFVAGAMFYLIRKEGVSFFKLFIIVLSYISSLLYALKYLDRQIEHFGVPFSPTLVILIISLFYIIFFLISFNKTKYINKKIFIYFGVITYPLYLIHQNIGYILFNYFGENFNKYLLLFLVVFFMIVIASFMEYIISKKVSNNLKLFFNYKLKKEDENLNKINILS